MKSKSMPVKLGLTFLMAVMVVSTGRAWTSGVVSRTWTLGGRHFSSPAIGSDGTIYVGSTNGCLYALNPNGTTQGVCNVGKPIYASAAIGPNGAIYVGTASSNFYAFLPNGITQHVWTSTNRQEFYSSPAIAADGTVYVGCDDGTATPRPIRRFIRPVTGVLWDCFPVQDTPRPARSWALPAASRPLVIMTGMARRTWRFILRPEPTG